MVKKNKYNEYLCFKIFLLLLVILFQGTLQSQPKEINFEHLTVKDGLSQSYITSIIQDKLGFLWIGTQDGLNKYDGYKFTVFTCKESDSNTISDNWVTSLVIDNDQNIWVGTGGKGVTKLSYTGKDNIRYPFYFADSTGLCHGFISQILIDSEELIWFATWGGGLCKYDPSIDKFFHFRKNKNSGNSISDNEISTVIEDSKGYLWMGTYKSGIDRFDKRTGVVKNYRNIENETTSLCFNWVTSLCEDRTGNLWIGTYGGGLDRFNNDSKEFYHYNKSNYKLHGFKDSLVTLIYEDSEGQLWIGTDGGGIYIFDEERDYFYNYPMDPTDPSALNDDRIWSILEDNSGIIWIGGFSGGLNKFDKSKNWFKHYRSNPYNPNSLKNNFVKAIIVDKYNQLWVGHNKGITIINRSTKEYKHLSVENGDKCIKNNMVRSLLEDIDGSIWIGTWGGGITNYNPKTNNCKNYMSDPDDEFSLSEIYVRDIYLDSKEQIWICTSRGLNKFNRSREQFEVYLNDHENPNSLCDNLLYEMIEDSYGYYWIGTSNGLSRLDPTTNEFKTFQHDPSDSLSLSQNRIRSIYQDSKGQLWIGTFGGGLNLFDYEAENFRSYTVDDGLANNVVYQIAEDNKSFLWLSSNKGLSKFDMINKTFKNYTVSDGLQSNEFNGGASFKSKDGELFFGGINGINSFYFKNEIRENASIPTIVITEFKIFHEVVTPVTHPDILPDDINNLSEIELSYDQNYITLEVAALQFTAPSKNEFKYFLEGFEKEWNYTDAGKRYATYTNLDPGKYIIHVIGSNNDGVWNEKGISLSIIITPPWWGTNLAYITYALLIIGVFIGLWRFKINRIKLKHQVEIEHMHAEKYNEINKIKSRFFTNISHAFRTPLTLVLGLIEKTLSKTDNREVKNDLFIVQKSAKRLNKLITQLLDLAKMEANSMKLRASEQNIIPFIEGLVLSFTSFAAKKRITLKFNSSSELILVYFDEEFISKIINNLLSNACKFTLENGCVEVNVKNSGDPRIIDDSFKTIEISVSDTGIGIPSDELDKIFNRFYHVDGSDTREKKGIGIGLSITKELVEIHHGEITVTSEVDKGSSFVVSLPLGKEHLNINEIIEEEKADTREVFDEMLVTKSHIINKDRNNYHMFQDDKPILLIVEDNNDMRNYIKEYVDEDYNVIEAADGKEGEDLALKFMPDMIISDVMMPQMDGFQLCDKLKSDERTSHIPIILLTAKATNEDKLAGIEKGADAYMMKPFDIKELLLRSKTLVEQRKKIREHFINEGFFNCNNKDISSIDKTFLKKVVKIIEDHLPDNNFSIDILADGLAVSRSQLHRKLISLIGESPSKLIQRIRLDRAVELIKQNFGNISEIALEVGFLNPGYFTKCFHNQFGKNPSEY